MGGYCDYMLFTPAMFPLIPPCKTLKCDLNIAFAPNNSKERMIMSVVRNYYGLNPFGYASEKDMVDNLTSSNNNNGVYDRSGITLLVYRFSCIMSNLLHGFTKHSPHYLFSLVIYYSRSF